MYNAGGGRIPINIGRLGDYTQSFSLFDMVLSAVIGFLTVIAGVYFIFIVITGGMTLISSGGEKGALEDARKKILTGVIGLVIVIAGVFIADLIGYFLGLNILTPGAILQNLVP